MRPFRLEKQVGNWKGRHTIGADIHCRFERRNPDGTWESVLNTNPTKYDRERHVWECAAAREEGRPDPLMYKRYAGRDYHLFAMLADVRNDGGVVPIAPTHRGVPADASVEYLRLVEQWGVDGHSHTWVTMEEVFDQTWHHRRTPGGSTYLSTAEGFVTLCWEVLMEHRVEPMDLRLAMFFDN